MHRPLNTPNTHSVDVRCGTINIMLEDLNTECAAPLYFFSCPESGELLVGARKPPVAVFETVLSRTKWNTLSQCPTPLSEALGITVTVPSDFEKRIEYVLTDEVRRFLPLLRKMGGLICGFEKCRIALRRNEVYCLLQASDGSTREQQRLTGNRKDAALRLWTATELGRVFGRDSVHHAAVTKKTAQGAWQSKVTALRLFSEAAEVPCTNNVKEDGAII